MTGWKNVLGSQPTRPREWDVDSSKTTVYQRRNISRVTVDDAGEAVGMWRYEERQMSHEEYALVRDERLDQLRADIDFLFAMTDIEP